MNEKHIVSSFDRDLSELNQMVARLGGMAEQQLAASIDALETRAADKLDGIIGFDTTLDDLEFAINDRALEVIAMRSPMATDLRRIVAALKVGAVLERIGDYAKNIAKRTKVIIAEERDPRDSISVARMANVVQQMLNQVLDAYATGNDKLAMEVWDRDQEVDQMHTGLYSEVLSKMNNPNDMAAVHSHFLFIAKNIERIGDHTTTVAEQVYFLVNGVMPGDERPKADGASTSLGKDL
jgi:phosphate transport system protein